MPATCHCVESHMKVICLSIGEVLTVWSARPVQGVHENILLFDIFNISQNMFIWDRILNTTRA